MKILFFASHPNLSIGYSRVANILTNFLADLGHDVYYLAISNFGNNHIDRFVNPSIKIYDAYLLEKQNGTDELYGVNVICDLFNTIQPDLLFLYNDIIVISRIFNNFINNKININCKVWTYLDLVYDFEKIELVNHIDKFSNKIFVFSDCWRQNLIDMGINQNKIIILYHGLNIDTFTTLDTIKCKSQFNFTEDDFIVLNTNRNNYRKGIDLTIDSFLLFLKLKNNNANIKLFLNMNYNTHRLTEGYDILNLIKISCIKHKLDFNLITSKHIFVNNNTTYSENMLNTLYNACDVGINTCVGEGFGLCNLEHSGVGKPQIVSGVGALKDIFTNDYSIVVEPIAELYLANNIEFHGGFIKICSVIDYVNALVKYYDDTELRKKHGEIAKNVVLNKYNWNNVLKELEKQFLEFHI
jgi:glycosyltransferase involved in cell wall biosynthesis